YPRWDYPTFGQLQEPLGLLHIGAVLKEHGHKVKFFDLAVDAIELVDEAVADANLVGISSSTVLFGRACLVLNRIKKNHPELPVIIGGPHATLETEDAVIKGFDAAVVGEGEYTALDIVRALEKGTPLYEVAGAAAKKGDQYVRGPERGWEQDLDAFPDPDRSLIDNYSKYFDNGIEFVGMMATRGCPYKCLFCKPMLDHMHGPKVRSRSPKRIAQEMANVANTLGYKRFLFKDDTMVLGGVEWFVELERELAAAGLPDSKWICQARVDQISPALLEQMKKCGLEAIAFGVESGSQKVLDFFRKGIKIEQTIKAFDLCHEYGVGTLAFIMLGAPIETREDLESTVKLVERIRPECISFSIATPGPGNALHEYAVENKIRNVASAEGNDYQYNLAPIELSLVTKEDVSWAANALLDAVPNTYYKDEMKARADRLAEGA
ncbi:MAG: B12-binding domain-containing radical SAM protein, partial [Deltaproteobacteria bacterium]|nr:B12-binding domain-containing radical SAM protein [Deltaproteobacteria bacterium]